MIKVVISRKNLQICLICIKGLKVSEKPQNWQFEFFLIVLFSEFCKIAINSFNENFKLRRHILMVWKKKHCKLARNQFLFEHNLSPCFSLFYLEFILYLRFSRISLYYIIFTYYRFLFQILRFACFKQSVKTTSSNTALNSIIKL